jgi:hypothetical protein
MSQISSMSEDITPEPLTLTVQQYDNPSFNLTIDQSDAPVNLANYHAVQIVLKANVGDADNAMTSLTLSTLTSGITITNAALGQCAVTFPAFTSNSEYTYWRADLLDSSGNIFTVLYGAFNIEPN